MRSFIAATALFAGLSMAATTTTLKTEVQTITSCGPSVTNCPATIKAALATGASSPAASLTSTVYSYEVVTITSCAPTVTNCPARVSTNTYAVSTTVIPAPTPKVNLGNGTAATGGYASGSGTYNMPAPTGAYKGPSFTGGAASLSAGAALAGVGAVAALFL